MCLFLPCKFASCEWNDMGSNFGIQTVHIIPEKVLHGVQNDKYVLYSYM